MQRGIILHHLSRIMPASYLFQKLCRHNCLKPSCLKPSVDLANCEVKEHEYNYVVRLPIQPVIKFTT